MDNFTVKKDEAYTIITTHVEKLDSLTAPDIKTQLVMLTKSGYKSIIVNLEETKYVDSSGLSALLTGNRLCKDLKGSFVICCMQPNVEKLVQISQLESVLDNAPTQNEAVDIIMMDEIERDIANQKEKK